MKILVNLFRNDWSAGSEFVKTASSVIYIEYFMKQITLTKKILKSEPELALHQFKISFLKCFLRQILY